MDKSNDSDGIRPVREPVSPIAALVLGIIGLVLALLAFLPCLGWVAVIPGLLCAILSVGLGVVAVRRNDNRTYCMAKGALTCGCIALVVIIGAVIYQGMILAPVMKQADVHTHEFQRTALRAVNEAKKEMCPDSCEAVDRVVSIVIKPDDSSETVTETFLEVAPPPERGATAELEGPGPEHSNEQDK